MAVGRIGCLLTELPGTPTGRCRGASPSTPAQAARLPAAAGVPLHPSFAYEIVFQLLAFAALLWLRGRITAAGRAVHAVPRGYAVFRFLVEFVRGNEVVFAGLTRPQLFLPCACRWSPPAWRGRSAAASTWRSCQPGRDREV